MSITYKQRNNNLWRFLLPIIIFLAVLIITGGRKQPFEKSTYVLDTYVTVKVFDASRATEKEVADVFKLLYELEKVVNFYDEESLLSQLNQELQIRGRARIDSRIKEPVKLSLYAWKETQGKYDPAVGKLVEIWAFDKGGRLPGAEEIRAALESSGARHLSTDAEWLIADVPLKLDLGGISKGWAVDKAAEMLKSKGYKKFLINSVSSTYVFNVLDNEPVKIGVENPSGKGILAVIKIKGSAAVSTSADNQRYFVVKGRRYHHILDPQTGYPAGHYSTLTVAGNISAALADAYSTGMFVMSPDEMLNFAKEKKLKVLALTRGGKFIVYPDEDWIEILTD